MSDRSPAGSLGDRGQFGDRLGLKQVQRRQRQSGGAGAGDHPHRQQRLPAQIKKVVRGADPLDPQ